MGYRNGVILAEEENGVSTSVNDALLFTTMCIIGHPVDVHVKDGSIYSGTLYTASLDNAYAVVLKKARRIKKGNWETNVAGGKLIDTLLILSEDLVQVVAKEILLPAEGMSGKVGADSVGAMSGIVHQNVSDERLANVTNHREPNLDKKQNNCSRLLDPIKDSVPNNSLNEASMEVASRNSDGKNTPVEVGCQKSDSITFKRGNAKSVSSNGRQVGDSSEVKQGGFQMEPALQADQTTDEIEGSRSSMDACGSHSSAIEKINARTNKDEKPNSVSFERSIVLKPDDPHVRHTLEETQQSLALSSGISADVTSDVHVGSDFSLNSSSAPIKVVLSRKGNHGQATKESKLNPRAKLFSPSPVQNRSATPPSVPSPLSMTHTPDPSPVVPIAAAEPEVDINSFAYRSSLPAKFVPHNHLFYGNGCSDLPYAQHVVGHVGSRTPPLRYTSQYNHLPAGPPYAHPSSQNVIAGRMGPLVYVHPVPNDAAQDAAGFPQLSSRPLMAPHQVNIAKHQGTATMQALQLYVTPPFIANGQQTFAMPTYIPISPPLFPVVGSIPVPGSDGSLSAKFA